MVMFNAAVAAKPMELIILQLLIFCLGNLECNLNVGEGYCFNLNFKDAVKL